MIESSSAFEKRIMTYNLSLRITKMTTHSQMKPSYGPSMLTLILEQLKKMVSKTNSGKVFSPAPVKLGMVSFTSLSLVGFPENGDE